VYRRTLLIVLAMIVFIAWIIGSFWYIFMPKSVREFCRKHPGFDLRSDIKNVSDLQIRLTGVCLFILGCFFEIGLITVIIGW